MIKKQNLWIISLFSLILVLSIYYFSMNDIDLSNLNIIEDSTPVINVENGTYLESLRMASDEETLTTMEELESVINRTDNTIQEKNDAYQAIKNLNTTKSKELELEKLVKEKFGLDSFIKITGDNINVTIIKDDHNMELANNIINEIQNKFEMQKYITVKFKK